MLPMSEAFARMHHGYRILVLGDLLISAVRLARSRRLLQIVEHSLVSVGRARSFTSDHEIA